VLPDLLTDQTSAHDPLNGYVPNGMTLEAARELRRKIRKYKKRALAAIAQHVQGMLDLQKLAQLRSTTETIFALSRFNKALRTLTISLVLYRLHPPAFLRGQRAVRWAALSGNFGYARTDQWCWKCFAMRAFANAGSSWAQNG